MLTQIQEQTPKLSRAKQRVARWVIEHPKQASRATLAEVARECGTSEPTVIRFCRHQSDGHVNTLADRYAFDNVVVAGR